MESNELATTPQKIVIWAKVTGHPFWPARYCDQEEEDYHARFKQRKNDLLVHFFAAGETGSYGWVIPSNVKDFDPSDLDGQFKGKRNKTLKAAILAAQAFCEDVAKHGYVKPSQIGSTDDGVCCICLKDEAFGTILLCDACDKEYHLTCLDPPLTSIPEGDWFCPKCRSPGASPSPQSTVLGKRPSVEQTKPGKNKKNSKSRTESTLSSWSEDKCGVCGTEGELLVCDFPGCPKVYHATCIWPTSLNAEAQRSWFCPRHACCVCSRHEAEQAHRKCSRCTLACCKDHDTLFSTLESSRCIFCDGQSPKAELGFLLHDCWSKVSSHYLSLPFMRPFLSTVQESQGVGDLLGVLEKIRRLEYSTSAQFLGDLNHLRNRLRSLPRQYLMILEAFDSVLMKVNQVLLRHKSELEAIELATTKNIELNKWDTMGVGLHGHDKKRLPDLTPSKTLSEWVEYVENPPVNDMSNHSHDDVPVNSLASILVEMSTHSSEVCGNTLKPEALLDSQSALLRQLMTSHSKLRSNWQHNRETLLAHPPCGEANAITLGEAHVIVELQMANQVLKSQLEQNRLLLGSKTEELELSVLQCRQLREQNEELMAQLKK